MTDLLTDLESLLHKVEMSQICLADMIHDCKTEAEADTRAEYRARYEFRYELETCLRTWRNRIREKGRRGWKQDAHIDSTALERLLYSDIDESVPPEEGWWKDSTQIVYRQIGQRMMRAGMEIEEIVPLLCKLYYATAEEFGY